MLNIFFNGLCWHLFLFWIIFFSLMSIFPNSILNFVKTIILLFWIHWDIFRVDGWNLAAALSHIFLNLYSTLLHCLCIEEEARLSTSLNWFWYWKYLEWLARQKFWECLKSFCMPRTFFFSPYFREEKPHACLLRIWKKQADYCKLLFFSKKNLGCGAKKF